MQILPNLSEEERNFFFQEAEEMIVKKGAVIYECADEHSGIYYIENGSVLLVKKGLDGDQKIFYVHKNDDIFGYRNLLKFDKHEEIAIANSDVKIKYLPLHKVKELLSFGNKLEETLYDVMTHDCMAMINRLNIITHKNIKVKIAYFLLLLGDCFDFEEHFTLRREDFASLIGTVRESLIRVLKEMQKEGYIEIQKKEIKIKDQEKVLNLIRFNDAMEKDR